MKTTIQVSQRTLLLLKKLKEQYEASSYDEAIEKIAVQRKLPSFAGSLKKEYKAQSLKDILKNLRDKHDRF